MLRSSLIVLEVLVAACGVVHDVDGAPKIDATAMAYQPAHADPLFKEVFVDVDEWRDEPVRHRYLHGGFKGTDARFSIYFPPEAEYQGRFFQYILPVSGNEHAVEKPEYADPSYSIGFAVDSGAYLLESNGGKLDFLPAADPTITLWRASAAVAEHSRVLANQVYPKFGLHRPFGYAWGGSGGAYKTMACVENTRGVWDGAVPFVHGTQVSLPNNLTVQAHAMRLLRTKFPEIVDALEPGGSGDPRASLDDDQRAAFDEVTKMGVPPHVWFNYETIAFGYTGVLASLLDAVISLDKSYFDDFWKLPGYLGADHPESFEGHRVHHETTVRRAITAGEARELGVPLSLSASQPHNAAIPAAFVLEDLPQADLQGATLTFKSGAARGLSIYVAGVFGDRLSVGYGQGFAMLADVEPGDRVELDNSVYLAVQTYHRHQTAPAEYHVYDQYRDEAGEPLYPQRAIQSTALFNQSGSQSGKFSGKMIVVQNSMDESAFPWQADWYRARVQAEMGDEAEDNYRLWFVEHAMHTPPSSKPTQTRPAIGTRIVNYGSVLQQALRDLSAWVEKGVPAPASTNYRVVDGQVQLPPSAAERSGVQAVVTASVNGAARADVQVGERVGFAAAIETSPGSGPIVGVEWDFEGAGDFPVIEVLEDTSSTRLRVETSYTFSTPGTYFPAVRASTQREGNPSTPYARIQNLARVRVVVR